MNWKNTIVIIFCSGGLLLRCKSSLFLRLLSDRFYGLVYKFVEGDHRKHRLFSEFLVTVCETGDLQFAMVLGSSMVPMFQWFLNVWTCTSMYHNIPLLPKGLRPTLVEICLLSPSAGLRRCPLGYYSYKKELRTIFLLFRYLLDKTTNVCHLYNIITTFPWLLTMDFWCTDKLSSIYIVEPLKYHISLLWHY